MFQIFGEPILELYKFDTDTQTPSLLAGEAGGVVGASEDASFVYFTSKEDLAAGATAGEWNLYLDHDGAKTFVATISEEDRTGRGPGLVGNIGASRIDSPRAFDHATRVTADGQHLAFMSNRSLTGYDNIDAINGKPSTEVYLYDAGVDQLTCVSCNPSGARPVGQELQVPYAVLHEGGGTKVWAAAWLQTWVHNLYSSRALSDDGNRLFFNSFDALLPEDTNGAQDVYQWEAEGSGTCEEAGGCLDLISTGKGSARSEFIDATPDGDEVFLETASSIDPRDPGLIDIYAARVNGGFPVPPSPPGCIGDACQSIPAAPNDPTPASANFRGAGNPSSGKPRRSCRVRKSGKSKSHAQTKRAKGCKRAKRGSRR